MQLLLIEEESEYDRFLGIDDHNMMRSSGYNDKILK